MKERYFVLCYKNNFCGVGNNNIVWKAKQEIIDDVTSLKKKES